MRLFRMGLVVFCLACFGTFAGGAFGQTPAVVLTPTYDGDSIGFNFEWTASTRGSAALATCTLTADVIGDTMVGQVFTLPTTPDGGEIMTQLVDFPMSASTAAIVLRVEAAVRCHSVTGTSSGLATFVASLATIMPAPETVPGLPGNFGVQPVPVVLGSTIIIVPPDGQVESFRVVRNQ